MPEESRSGLDAEPRVVEYYGIPEEREEDGEGKESRMKTSRVGDSHRQKSAQSQAGDEELEVLERSTETPNDGAEVPAHSETDEEEEEPQSKRLRTDI